MGAMVFFIRQIGNRDSPAAQRKDDTILNLVPL
jgi:hypothetical protein